MTIQVNTWYPDTCKCVTSFWWDDTLPSDQRVHHPFCLGVPDNTKPGMVLGAGACNIHAELLPADPFPLFGDELTKLQWHIKMAQAVGWMPAQYDDDGGHVGNENVTKSKVVNTLVANVVRARKPVEGDGFVLADNITVEYSFTGTGANRLLTMRFLGINLTGQEKAMLRTEATKFRKPVTIL